MTTQYKYTPQDFKNKSEVKWCPGCGDHAILNSVVKALPEVSSALNIPQENFTFISGIGCSSRFPYYMDTYGFHTIHGRALPIATGTKLANPELSVWVATGDGDSLAIGGNHFIHAVRRNIDINVVVFNNQIYGLTKGQYSPTSKLGQITGTSPMGTIEQPFNPAELAFGARADFFARAMDIEMATTTECLVEAGKHRGISIVEVLQNCVIFNDKPFADFAGDKAARAENILFLKHGEKMIFGANRDKGLVLDGLKLKAVRIGENGVTEADILTHDAHEADVTLHRMLANMKYPEHPVAMGVIRDVEGETYDERLFAQLKIAAEKNPVKDMDAMLNGGETWEVK